MNLHVYDNAVYYGSGALQKATASANTVITFRRLKADRIFFKNYTAGQNGRIEIVGVIS